jgi:hypothetical protein
LEGFGLIQDIQRAVLSEPAGVHRFVGVVGHRVRFKS